VLAVVGVAVGMLWWTGAILGHAAYTGTLWTVKKERLKVTIVARGSLESASNGDIFCKVRSGTKGSTIATTIKSLVDAGVMVKKDEEVMVLDASGFIEQDKDKQKDVKQALSAKIKAEQDFEIQKINNETDIEKAVNAFDLAKIDLEKYKMGDYEQSLKDVLGRIQTAESDLADWKDRAAWSARMVKKRLMSKVQADADANRVDASSIALAKVQEELRVLEKYTKGRNETDLQAKVNEAERGVKKAKLNAEYTLKYLEADRDTKQAIFDLEEQRLADIKDQIKQCVVRAPQDGLVVYYVPEQVRGGGGSVQSIVAQGEPVRESQKMLQIPDLNNMLVNLRVPEAFLANLHKGATATVKVDTYPTQPLKGHVSFVDTVASQQDWFAADVRVYKTYVAIDRAKDGDMPPLKPGMSAVVTITTDDTTGEVLVVPIQAVLGTVNMGPDRKCFVIDSDGQPKLRDIRVGKSNERLVEVESGLAEGDKVVENPRALLEEGNELKAGKGKASKGAEDAPGGNMDPKSKGKKGPPAGGPAGKTPGQKADAGTPNRFQGVEMAAVATRHPEMTNL
jgi:HlyD family secretion protein